MNLQIVKISLIDLDSISLYRSNSKSLTETSTSITKMIDLSKATLITGDFNVCLSQKPNNIITTTLVSTLVTTIIATSTYHRQYCNQSHRQ